MLAVQFEASQVHLAPGDPRSKSSTVAHQEENPAYWRRWLREQGLASAVERQVGEYYRSLRGALERTWTYAYTGAVVGSVTGVLLMAVYARLVPGAFVLWYHVLIAALGAALLASAGWWIAYWLSHRMQLRSDGRRAAGGLRSEDEYVEQVISTVAAGLAQSEFRPRDHKLDVDQLAQTTMFTGLREAPTAELERHLLERLAGSAFVPTPEGSIHVFKLGPDCASCGKQTLSGPLRILNVPAHWATDNGYLRLKEVPSRGRHLLAVPERLRELTDYLGPPKGGEGVPAFHGPRSRFVLCETCARDTLRRGILQDMASLERGRERPSRGGSASGDGTPP